MGAKLQLKPGISLAVLAAPEGLALDLAEGITPTDVAAQAGAVLAFVTRASDVDTIASPAVRAALDDRLAWIAYPKAGQLGTDLNRDSLAELVIERGGRPVRQVSIDAVWSALRFRPGPAN